LRSASNHTALRDAPFPVRLHHDLQQVQRLVIADPSGYLGEEQIVPHAIKGNVYRLPISKTFRNPSPSLDRGIRLKANRWSFSRGACGGVVRIFCSCCPISHVR
jgi:hypothetical protein